MFSVLEPPSDFSLSYQPVISVVKVPTLMLQREINNREFTKYEIYLIF